MPVYRITQQMAFPPVSEAEPDGLLAVGGDLRAERLLLAYQSGIFPWSSEGQPLLWWSPDPRCVLFPDSLRIPRNIQRRFRCRRYSVTFDHAFREVMAGCQRIPRPGQSGTWITDALRAAYTHLHDLGYAHSVEVWMDRRLAGGLYGVALGRVFFGESMFSCVADASTLALIELTQRLTALGFAFLDCQFRTDHLARLGAVEIPRKDFLRRLRHALQKDSLVGSWREWPASDGWATTERIAVPKKGDLSSS